MDLHQSGLELVERLWVHPARNGACHQIGSPAYCIVQYAHSCEYRRCILGIHALADSKLQRRFIDHNRDSYSEPTEMMRQSDGYDYGRAHSNARPPTTLPSLPRGMIAALLAIGLTWRPLPFPKHRRAEALNGPCLVHKNLSPLSGHPRAEARTPP